MNDEKPHVCRPLRHKTGAHDDGPRKVLLLHREELPQKVGAHAVAQDEIRKVRIVLPRHPVQGLHVIDQEAVRVLLPEKAKLLVRDDGVAVAHVVVADDHKAAFLQKVRKLRVPSDVLHHAVHELHDADRLSLRHAAHRVHLCPAVL